MDKTNYIESDEANMPWNKVKQKINIDGVLFLPVNIAGIIIYSKWQRRLSCVV